MAWETRITCGVGKYVVRTRVCVKPYANLIEGGEADRKGILRAALLFAKGCAHAGVSRRSSSPSSVRLCA